MGMKQRLGIAMALMEDPEIILLDEPFNGLDETGVISMRELLKQMRDVGKTIVLASHSKEDIQVLCDKVLHLDKGRLINNKNLGGET